MDNRRNMMIWMKDLIDHMAHCHDQLQWTNDGPTQAFLADSLMGDLYQFQKLCEQLRRSPKGANQDSGTHYESDGGRVCDVSFRGSMALS